MTHNPLMMTRGTIESFVPVSSSGQLFYAPLNVVPITENGLQMFSTCTNLILQSHTMAASGSHSLINPWNMDGNPAAPVVSGSASIAPDSTYAATRITFPAINGAGQYTRVIQNFTATAASWTLSFWAKTVSGTGTLYVDTYNNTTTLYVTASFAVTNEWQRFSFVTTQAANVISVEIGNLGSIRGEPSVLPELSIYLWGIQMEARPYASPYTPSITSAGVRNTTKVTTLTILTDPRNFCVGVRAKVADGMSWSDESANYPGLWSIGVQDQSNSVTLYRTNGLLSFFIYNFVHTGNYITYNCTFPASFTPGSQHDIVIEVKNGIVRFYIDRILTSHTRNVAGAGAGIPTSFPTTFYVGCNASYYSFNGWIKKLVQGNDAKQVLSEMAR